MRRRTLLSRVGGFAAGSAAAGCLAVPDGSTPTPSPPPSDSGDHPVTPADQTFDVTDRSCGQGDNDATVGFGEGSVRVAGVIAGRDTCDTARLASASLHLDVLTVTVEVVEEETTATPACGQCLTDTEYAYRASNLRGGPAQVRVVHRTADGERTVAVADRP